MRTESARYFDSGYTSFRFFEWLNPYCLKTRFKERWKLVMLDFAGAYLKLTMLGIAVSLTGIAFLSSL